MSDIIYEEQGYILELPINGTNYSNNTIKGGITSKTQTVIFCIVFVIGLIIYNGCILSLFINKKVPRNQRMIQTDIIRDRRNSPINFNIEFNPYVSNIRRNPINVEYNPIRDIMDNVNMLREEYNEYKKEQEQIIKILNYETPGEYIISNDTDEICPICISVNDTCSIKLKKCSHIFHDNCIREHIISKHKNNEIPLCPMCRTPIY